MKEAWWPVNSGVYRKAHCGYYLLPQNEALGRQDGETVPRPVF